MENDRADGPERVRLPGFDDRTEHGRPAYTWRGEQYGPPGGYWPPGFHRDSGVLRSRRASTWTAAALIAGVAATTGYLAHAIPGTGGSTTGTGTGTGTGTAKPAGKSTVVKPGTPAVTTPVATSGGSGGAGGAGGGDN